MNWQLQRYWEFLVKKNFKQSTLLRDFKLKNFKLYWEFAERLRILCFSVQHSQHAKPSENMHLPIYPFNVMQLQETVSSTNTIQYPG